VHHRLTPIEAARLGKDLEPYRLFWMEDAVPAELQEGFRLIRQHSELTNDVFVHDYHFEQGYMYLGDKVGHGGDIDEKLAAKYPYQRAYLPVNRLEDGAMFNW
jgi:L-alanine-DL-glutamate epimerase-like enolase superfamily enzyme